MSSVTLSLAKAHLRVDDSGEDELIQLYIDAAEAWFENFTGRKLAKFDPVPPDVRRAILNLVGFYYAVRESVTFGDAVRMVPFDVQHVATTHRVAHFGEEVADDF